MRGDLVAAYVVGALLGGLTFLGCGRPALRPWWRHLAAGLLVGQLWPLVLVVLAVWSEGDRPRLNL
jgi:hypothetical protein